MQFSENDIERFAAWSGDHNPLHIDAEFVQTEGYRQPVVPGILATFGALASVSSRAAGPLTTLEIRFRGDVAPNVRCDVGWARGPGEFSVSVRQGGAEVVAIAGEVGPGSMPSARPDLSWVARLEGDRAIQERGKRPDPADRNFDELHAGFEIAGVYATDPPPESATAGGHLAPVQARVLGLCGYLVGMEAPGLRSCFTHARLRFTGVRSDSNQLWYHARTIRFDRESRLLDIAVEVTTPDGQLLATGELKSCVRATRPPTNLTALAARLHPGVNRLAGKVALVCGGSRGLGAELTSALALAGCRVYAGFHTASAAAAKLARRLAERNLEVAFLQGDAGDPAWCAATLETIQARHGRLDVLVLNACAPPAAFPMNRQSAAEFDDYLRTNLRLGCVPLATFLPLLEESRGMVASISSSMLNDPPAGFAHYVALKLALEGAVQTATREAPHLWSLIVRPPRLPAAWSDHPGTVGGAISADVVAAGVVNRLAREWHAGQAEWLSEHDLRAASAWTGPAGSLLENSPSVADDFPATAAADEVEQAGADARDREFVETAGLDAEATLLSIDAMIAAELAHPPAIADEPQKLLTFEEDPSPIPVLAEIDHWHGKESQPVSASAGSCPIAIDEAVTENRPAVAQPAPAAPSLPEFSPEDRLHDFLNEFQTQVAETVGFRGSDGDFVEENAHEVERAPFAHEVL
ncbi:MAG: SDR family NAD(P)-dependent oxidoreductase, partial [Deltaproteobacteria bacterium]